MITKNTFAINQIITKYSKFEDFISFAKQLNINKIEIRNDIKENLLLENKPLEVKDLCKKNKINILSINALQKFNIWNNEREIELLQLCDYASKANVWAIVLVPLNDGSVPNETDQIDLLRLSLRNISKILNNYDLIGLVEPLGFIQSTLRKKSLVIQVIEESQITNIKLLHDTFHHKLSEEKNFYINSTGLVHISGVSNQFKNHKLTDDYRSTIQNNDLIENINQIKRFLNSGYSGVFSFEPFSEELINDVDKLNLTQKTFDFILSNFAK